MCALRRGVSKCCAKRPGATRLVAISHAPLYGGMVCKAGARVMRAAFWVLEAQSTQEHVRGMLLDLPYLP
jgi:hypothetical protein